MLTLARLLAGEGTASRRLRRDGLGLSRSRAVVAERGGFLGSEPVFDSQIWLGPDAVGTFPDWSWVWRDRPPSPTNPGSPPKEPDGETVPGPGGDLEPDQTPDDSDPPDCSESYFDPRPKMDCAGADAHGCREDECWVCHVPAETYRDENGDCPGDGDNWDCACEPRTGEDTDTGGPGGLILPY